MAWHSSSLPRHHTWPSRLVFLLKVSISSDQSPWPRKSYLSWNDTSVRQPYLTKNKFDSFVTDGIGRPTQSGTNNVFVWRLVLRNGECKTCKATRRASRFRSRCGLHPGENFDDPNIRITILFWDDDGKAAYNPDDSSNRIFRLLKSSWTILSDHNTWISSLQPQITSATSSACRARLRNRVLLFSRSGLLEDIRGRTLLSVLFHPELEVTKNSREERGLLVW